MDVSIQQIIDFHIKENEKDDEYFMDVEIHDDFDYITLIQQNWKENETMVNSFIKYCLAKQYQISKWKTQEHKFERKPNWIEFQGMTLCPVTWLLDTGLKTVGWIDVKTDNVYSNQMLEFAIAKKTSVKIAKPSVLGCRSYINFNIDKRRQLSRHLLMWRSAMGIPYNVHFNENTYDIDHIDPNTYLDEQTGKMILNDNIKNLQILSRKDHNKKTEKDNPNIRKNMSKTRKKIVYQWKDKQKTEFIKTFESLTDAAKFFNIKTNRLNMVIKRNHKFFGYYFSYGKPEDELCEEGKEKFSRHTKKTLVKDFDGNEFYPNCYIYNTGIIQFPNNRMTIGALVKNDGGKGSRSVTLLGKTFAMYGLVNASFNGPRKNKTDQTAHLRRDGYIKYTEQDLAWQSPSENQTEAHGKKVKVFNKITRETIILDSLEQAATRFSLKSRTLSTQMIKFAVYCPKKANHLTFQKV